MNELIYDEFSQVGVDFKDLNKVNDYDLDMAFRKTAPETQSIFQQLGLTRDSTLLDVGTGTGSLSIAAAKLCKFVYAIDVSETMLNNAQKNAQKCALKNITFFKAGFLSYEHKGSKLDHIVSFLSLHHLPDFWKQIALLHLNSMMKMNGTFYLADQVFAFDANDYKNKLNHWVDINRERSHNESFVNDVKTSICKEYTTYSWILETMLGNAGFHYDIIKHSEFFAHYLCHKIKEVII